MMKSWWWLLAAACVGTCWAQPTLPSSLGCSPSKDGALWCRRSPMSNILHALRLLPQDDDTFKLKSIDITDSQMPYLPHVLKGPVERVSLVRSQLESVYPDAFASILTTLRFLDLSGNKLTTVPRAIDGLGKLEELNLAHNSIAAVEPGPFFRTLANLRVLNLASNMLGVSAEQVRRLRANPNAPKTLQLSPDLKLDQFDIRPASESLVRLDLSDNKLSSVPELVQVAYFPRLEKLDLGHNFLGSLPVLKAHNYPKLRKLILKKNKLRTLPFLAWPGTLQEVNLADNPLQCDCDASWLLESSRLINLSLPRCDESGTLLSGMSHSDLCPQESQSFHGNDTGLFRYVAEGPRHQILSLSPDATKVNVTWTGDEDGSSADGWQLLYRRQNQDPQDMTFARRTGSTSIRSDNKVLHMDVLEGLTQDTGYVICLAASRGKQFIVQNERCRRVRTTVVFSTTTPKPTTTSTTPSPTTTAETKATRQRPRAALSPSTVPSAVVVATSGQIQVHPGKRRALVTSLTSTSDSLTMSWRMVTLERERRQVGAEARVRQAPGPIRQWTIRLRPFATFKTTEVLVDEDPEEEAELQDSPHRGYQYTATGLDPNSGYEVCLRDSTPVLQSDAMRQVPGRLEDQRELCKEVLTLPLNSLPVAVVSAAVSGTVSAVMVIVVCLGWPRCRGRKKDKPDDEVKMAPKGSSPPSSSSSSSSREGSSCTSNNMKPVQYIGGQKIQVLTRGCKTLPRSTGQTLIEGGNPAFHPRYSKPNSTCGDGPPVQGSPVSSSRWYQFQSSEAEPQKESSRRGYSSTLGRPTDRTSPPRQPEPPAPIRRTASPELPHYSIEYV